MAVLPCLVLVALYISLCDCMCVRVCVCVFMQVSQLDSLGRTVVTFDGSNASFATITHATPLLPDPGFTVTAWVHQTAGSAG